MLKIILNSRNFRHLPIVSQNLSFHITGSSISSQDYDISDDITMIQTARKKRSENKAAEQLGVVSPKVIKKKLKFYLDCTDEQVDELLKENKSFFKTRLSRLTRMIEFLFEKKINTQSILENSWLLEMAPGECELVMIEMLTNNNSHQF